MKTTDKNNVLQLYKYSGDFELLRLSFKSSGASAYLPKSIIGFLNLSKESRSLVAFLDSEGPYNFIIVTSDKNLSELLRPIILQRRQRAEQIQKQLKNTTMQQQVTEAKVME